MSGYAMGKKYSMPYGLDSLDTFQLANQSNQCLLHIGVSAEGVEAAPIVLVSLSFKAPAQFKCRKK